VKDDKAGADSTNNKGKVTSLTDIQSQKISETRELGFERLREKIRNQRMETEGPDTDGPSR
jgi:hypothetical protein